MHYFPDDLHGKLLPREKRILINARKPRCEHFFTVMHEIGHYVLHVLNSHRTYHPRILDFYWNFAPWLKFCSVVKRCIRLRYTRLPAKEHDADLWAFCLFLHFAKNLGCRDDLSTFLEHHPEKFRTFLLAAFGVACGGLKSRIRNILISVKALCTDWRRLMFPS